MSSRRSYGLLTEEDGMRVSHGNPINPKIFVLCAVSLILLAATFAVSLLSVPSETLSEQDEQNLKDLYDRINENANEKISVQLPLSLDESGLIEVNGTESEYTEISFENPGPLNFLMSGDEESKRLLKRLHLHYVHLDPLFLTEATRGAKNLESIRLDRVQLLNDNFSRVFLPNLKVFYFDQWIGFHEQFRDYENFTTPSRISSLLFFDDRPNSVKSLSSRILNPSVSSLAYLVDGWSVLSTFTKPFASTVFGPSWSSDPKTPKDIPSVSPVLSKEVVLAVPFTNEILLQEREEDGFMKTPINGITLTECSVSLKALALSDLLYLNLYHVNILDGTESEVIRTKTKLESLFIENDNATVAIRDIPKSLKFLGLGPSNLIWTKGETVSTSIASLISLNDLQVIKNFDTIFINLQYAAIFDQHENFDLLLTNVLRTNASKILVDEYTRTNYPLNPNEPVVSELSELLKNAGVESSQTFILTRNGNSWKGKIIPKADKIKLRFNLLGWSKYITDSSFRQHLMDV